MTTYTKDELNAILILHSKWLANDPDGVKANLESANLSGADLTGADLWGANLSGADLSGADLRCANLRGANLESANLSGADLSGADLRCANLRGANLESANLSGADLSGADLRCANLRGANLESANLSGADLSGADLRCANLRGANLESANLSGADLRCANLLGANLYGANLWSANLSEISGKQIQTFVYNRHTAYAIDDFITIGCECHPIAHWVEHYGAIGQEAGYTAEEIEAYGRWIKSLATVHKERQPPKTILPSIKKGFKYLSVIILGVLIGVAASHADNCILTNTTPLTYQNESGPFLVTSATINQINFDTTNGNIIFDFSTNQIHKMVNTCTGLYYYFRYNDSAYTTYTTLRYVTWVNNNVPPAGTYTITSYTTDKPLTHTKTMVTIGDSITWWENGEYMRCKLANQGFNYDFVGTQTDALGYAHEGKGGNTTQDVLGRINTIPHANAYFLLLGTNDLTLTSMQTVNNLMLIAVTLKNNNPGAKIYISTLLPRYVVQNTRNQDINNILRGNNWGADTTIVDVGGFFYSLPNWQTFLLPDVLHPTPAGYDLITYSMIQHIPS